MREITEQKRRRFLKTAGSVGSVGGIAALAGCGSNGGGGADSTATQTAVNAEQMDDLPEVEATAGHGDPVDPTAQVSGFFQAFKEYVESATDGQFSIEIVPGGSLGSYVEMIEQVQAGELEFVNSAEGDYATVYPNMNIVGVPYAFRSIDQALYTFEATDFAEQLYSDMEEQTGLKPIATFENGGMRNFFVNTDSAGEIRSRSDLEGLTIRTMNVEAHQELVRQLGANPEPVAWNELYSALDQGVVDGGELPIPVYTIPSLYEVTDYMILDRHLFSLTTVTTNGEFYDGLPATYQQVVDEAALYASMHSRRLGRILRNTQRALIEENDVTVFNPPQSTMSEFRDSSVREPVVEIIREQVDDPGLVDGLFGAIEEADEALGYV
jgi:tripartite ATP-independent transporter DctP family solute receptor